MIAPRQAAAVAIEAVVELFRFEVAIDGLTARACGAAARSRLDHHERGLVVLRHFSRR